MAFVTSTRSLTICRQLQFLPATPHGINRILPPANDSFRVCPIRSTGQQCAFLGLKLQPQSRRRWVRTRVHGLALPLISPNDNWGIFTGLFAAGAFGIWSERTKMGGMLSPALVSILTGLVASNLGLLPYEAPAYTMVWEYVLPLALPLLMFRADIRRVIHSTGSLLLAFLLGTVATTLGTVVAFRLVPMRSLGQDSWKLAAALMSSYIGGAVNYVAVSEALKISPSVLAGGLAADNAICAIYFGFIFALAAKIPPEVSAATNDVQTNEEHETGDNMNILNSVTAIALSFAICKLGTCLTRLFAVQGGSLPFITAIIVILATLFPHKFNTLASTGEILARILLQVFFSVIGANGSIWNLIHTMPSIFVFALIQVAVHLAFLLVVGKLLGFDRKILLMASNANVGGPTTASGMATTKGWNTLIVPGILAGIFGISIATFIGIGFGLLILKPMA